MQASTYFTAVLDLSLGKGIRVNIRGQTNSIHQFHSVYMQLLRLKILDELFLLNKVSLSDLSSKPPVVLAKELKCLKVLQSITLHDWLFT